MGGIGFLPQARHELAASQIGKTGRAGRNERIGLLPGKTQGWREITFLLLQPERDNLRPVVAEQH
ncbi:hypothetical protein D3C87_2110470 [compost metagenome]